GLKGQLDLSDFANLEELKCSDNELTKINLGKNTKLKVLNLSNNNFNNGLPKEEQELNFLSHLTDLEEVNLGNIDKEKIKKGIHNRFCGSLKSLEVLGNLRELNIS